MVHYNEALTAQAATLDTLLRTAQQISDAGDSLDQIGQVRLVELAAEQVRRAIITTARAEGRTWQEIGDALGTTRQNAQQRYGSPESQN